MNTSSVAKQLGVSSSTVKRWVKQLGLNLEKNEMGHFTYQQEDIELLRTYQKQQNEALLAYQEIAAGKDMVRKGMVQTLPIDSKLINRLQCLESLVQSKADRVVEYQMLQYRRELEEMQATIKKLEEKIKTLETSQTNTPPLTPTDQAVQKLIPRKQKKQGILASFFRSSTQHSS